MATNPPIVIGPFPNVPAPGSGVRSDWPQQISQYVTDHAFEYLYSQIVAAVPVNTNTAALAVNVINPGNVAYPNKPVIIEFFAPQVQTPGAAAGNSLLVNLWDAGVDLGIMGQLITPAAGVLTVPMCLRRRIIPTAGNHNYNVRAWCPAGAGNIGAGNGASPNLAPAYLRVIGA